MRFGIILFVLGLTLILGFAASVLADYTLVGKIPAPQPCPGTCPVTGLASAGDNLFATVVYDTTSYLYLIRPSDGLILDSYAWDIPYGGLYHPYFQGAAHAGGVIYWVADAANAMFLKFEFDDASVYLHSTTANDRIPAPTGLLWQNMEGESNFDALWVTDPEMDSLFLMEETGVVLEAHPLSGVTSGYSLNPTSVAVSGENLFFTSGNFTDSLFETSQSAARVDAHYLSDVGEMDLEGAAFHNGLLYVAGNGDSILIYESGTYVDPVPSGDSVVVHVIPDELDVGFVHVGEAGSLYVEVTPNQSCPPPEDVHFFGDFYDISTTATFDYITKVALTSMDFPQGVNPKNVRVFVRPSGECQTWRDVTVEMLEVEEPRSPVLARSGKRLSEDDEFSFFCFGEDRRRVADVIGLKYDYLDSAITQNQSWIPEEEYTRMTSLLTASRLAYALKRYRLAARGANRIATIARNTPQIPHTYDPEASPGGNVAGRIMSRAHTLAFSLDILIQEQQMPTVAEPSWKRPPINIVGESPDRLEVVPNPSSSAFRVRFSAPRDAAISLRIYSVEGELVRTLVEGEVVGGTRDLTWDGRNDLGMPVAAGTYFAVIEGGEERWVRKMVLQR
jgi:hypothetical protein